MGKAEDRRLFFPLALVTLAYAECDNPHVMPVDNFNRCTTTVTRGDGAKHTYSFIDESPNATCKATILAVHGFPDLAITYSRQIRAWNTAGYRVIAPDCLGYGNTDEPKDPKAYNIKNMAGDLKQILDHALGEDWKVIVVGHDWGSYLAQRFVGYHGGEGKALALILLSIPYMPPFPPPKEGEDPPDVAQLFNLPSLPLPTGEVIERPFKDFGYQLYFQDPQSTIDIHANLDNFLHTAFQPLRADKTLHIPFTGATMDGLNVISTQFGDAVTGKTPVDPNLPTVLTYAEFEHYRSKCAGRMAGPLNWYRDNAQRNIDEKTFPGLPPTLPVLFIHGKYDPTCLEYSLKLMKYLASVGVINARFEEVEAWHWITHERADEVNTSTVKFLEEVLA